MIVVGALIVRLVSQETLYSGGLHTHGFKHLTIDAPDGFTIATYGPLSTRRNDSDPLRKSGANNKFAALQVGIPQQYVMYGDGIYPNMSHVRSRHNVPTGPLRAQDVAMASCRESIEWHYEQADSLFEYMNTPGRLQIKDQHMPMKELYFCRLLLRNCHVSLYHNQTSQKFKCVPPTLDEYLV
jgi:hypothetical protein